MLGTPRLALGLLWPFWIISKVRGASRADSSAEEAKQLKLDQAAHNEQSTQTCWQKGQVLPLKPYFCDLEKAEMGSNWGAEF